MLELVDFIMFRMKFKCSVLMVAIFCGFFVVSCHPLMPSTGAKDVSDNEGYWRGINASKIYKLSDPIAVSDRYLDINQDVKYAKKVCPRGSKLRILSLKKVESFNGDYLSAKCKILTGPYNGRVFTVDFNEDFIATLGEIGEAQ